MCGIAGIFGKGWRAADLAAMTAAQRHRGPDAECAWCSPGGDAGLGHNRLSIIDLSPAGAQPMAGAGGDLHIVFNGEVYNYLELRRELDGYPWRGHSDTEVVLAAYERWGEACLERFVGMFSFLIWNERRRTLFAARDRFGVKPLYYHMRRDGMLFAASEIRALHKAGVPVSPDPAAWADYLACGLLDHTEHTFWKGVRMLPPGHTMIWRDGGLGIRRWYDIAERAGPEFDRRPAADVADEYLALLKESVALRFRSDVPVGINLSGGLDSGLLLGLVQAVQGDESDVKAFTYVTGDPRYDELPWVRQMLEHTRHPAVICRLRPEQVPALAVSVQAHQDEPFGGLPTLAYAIVFDAAREQGVTVLLDGQGMDEQWAGYDYYATELDGGSPGLVQGARHTPVRPDCLTPDFLALAQPLCAPEPFPDRLRNRQCRDMRYAKIPRVLRFNDRISMRASTELREPFLDHRLCELALRQPPERKIGNGEHKHLLRDIGRRLLPAGIVEAPKRPLQTPQREWLAGPLLDWADAHIEAALAGRGGAWLQPRAVRKAWLDYLGGATDNSFYVWQWISLAMSMDQVRA